MAAKTTLDGFQASTVPFTTVDGHDLKVDILLPDGLPAGKHPVIVNWHGGALITGSRYFKDMFPVWLQPFAAKHNAIVLSPDYRKLPEAHGVDILTDSEAFWSWLHTNFPKALQDVSSGKHQADLDRVLLNGASAGGWVALHQALTHPAQIRAVMLFFPMLAIDHKPRGPYTGSTPELLGLPLLSREELENEVAKLKQPSVFLEGAWDRAVMAFSALKLGVIGQWVGLDPKLDVYQRVKAGDRLPKKIWVNHGKEDSTIDIKGTEAIVADIREHCSGTELRVDYFPGDHGFDATIDPRELEPGLEWIQSAWLGH